MLSRFWCDNGMWCLRLLDLLWLGLRGFLGVLSLCGVGII